MPDYTRINLKSDVKDMAPEHNMEGIESRFARTNLELANSGLSYFRLDPGYRAPFGHTHSVRIAPGELHGMEAGPDGAEILAFGAPNTDNKDADMEPGWWPT